MKKAPYSFPLKSRAAMTDYLLNRRGYVDHYTRFAFSWNVKAHGVNWENPRGEYQNNPEHDSAWRARLDANRFCNSVDYNAIEDAQRFIVSEWSSYPGDDQGKWKFGFYGRSSGHLCLESWEGNNTVNLGDVAEWLASFSFPELRAFYRGIVCADSDFTRAKATAEIEWHANDARRQFEEALDNERDAADSAWAAALTNSRPDMYQAGR